MKRGTAIILLLCLALTACESEYSRRCRENGGVIHHVNCSTVLVPQFDGNGHLTALTPVEHCEERCVGADLEKK